MENNTMNQAPNETICFDTTSLPQIYLVDHEDTTIYVGIPNKPTQTKPILYEQVQSSLLLALVLLWLAHSFKVLATATERTNRFIFAIFDLPIDICLILIATYVSAIDLVANLETLVTTIVLSIIAMLCCCIIRSTYMDKCKDYADKKYVWLTLVLIFLNFIPVALLFCYYFIFS